MRDALFLFFLALSMGMTIRYPFMGLLVWAWFTLATPQQAVYFAADMPLNVMIAAVTFLSFFLHGEIKRARFDPVSLFLVAFGVWIMISHMMSLDQSLSAEPTDRFVKVLIFILMCMMVVTDRLRLHALLWLIILVMGFYGAKGAVYTVIKLGQGIYDGQAGTILADNNHMGIALAATLPLYLYMQGQVRHAWIRRGIQLVFLLSIIAIIGTTSRGAFLSLIVFFCFMWLRSEHKLKIAAAALVLAVPAFFLVPSQWTQKMETIKSADTDESFQGRVDAWVINTKLALANPLTGAGLRTAYKEHVSRQVDMFRQPRAAHSIYFEVLGGTGFVGLFLYLGMIGFAFLKALTAEKKYRYATHDRWRSPFARYAFISLATFCFGALSVSMEMWEGYLLVIAMISVLGKVKPVLQSDAAHNVSPAEKLKARMRALRDGDEAVPLAIRNRERSGKTGLAWP